MAPSPPEPLSYQSIRTQLLLPPSAVLPPSPSAPSLTLAHAISSLSLHPSLESALHILNNDLPSAHFLLRHMQAAPQYESMYLHGILHRIEGDYDNARAWYTDVKESDVFKAVWGEGDGNGGLEGAMRFIRRIEVMRKETKAPNRDAGEMRVLSEESKRELETVLRFCEGKFGMEVMVDASGVWVQDEKSKNNGNAMIVGGEGWRQF